MGITTTLRYRILSTVLRWLEIILILRVLVLILANYPSYFPPSFDSLFLQGREATFNGLYRTAFYLHIVSGPFVLLNGLLLLSESLRRKYQGGHRFLGRVQLIVLLLIMLPSGVVMSRQAFGGWPAGLSFLLLSLATACCAIMGVYHARNRNYRLHRIWMLRTYVLICSAVALRLISGALELLEITKPEVAYVVASWCSWQIPLGALELMQYFLVKWRNKHV